MKKNDLIKLGFKKEHTTAEQSGDKAYDYYTYDVDNECFLISSASDECVNGEYYVELFNKPDLGRTYDKELVKEYINTLNKFKTNG